jgi:predicted RNase H-like HicB family nuclease
MRKNGRRSKKTLAFEVVVMYDPKERGAYKYVAEVPGLQGCFTDGRTREEALKNIKDVIALILSTREDERLKATTIVEVAV